MSGVSGARMRILLLQKRLLFPVNSGWRVRTLNVVRYLARWHDVTYLCNVQRQDEPFVGEMRQLGLRLETVPWTEAPRHSWRFARDLAGNLLSRYPFTVDKDYDPALRRRAEELLASEPFDLVVCDFVQMARNAIGLPMPASVLFQHNVEAQIFARHAERDRRWFRRRYMAHQCRKMARFEGEAGRAFDLVVAVSEDDQRTFRSEYGWDHVRRIDTAVDTDFFRPSEEPESSDRLVFVGSLDWLPNEDGLEYFAREIWPLIRQRRPQVVCDIVGRNPSGAVARLGRLDGLTIHASVPDVRPFIGRAALAIVPLRIGGGTRLKVFEAMGMEKAVVSTSLGVEGLPVVPGKHLLVGDTPGSFAGAVAGLLEQPARRRALAQEARRFVAEHFSAEVVARQFERHCLEAGVLAEATGKS